MKRNDSEHGKNKHPEVGSSSRPKSTSPTGRKAAIERSIFAQDWREVGRLADREDSGDEIQKVVKNKLLPLSKSVALQTGAQVVTIEHFGLTVAYFANTRSST